MTQLGRISSPGRGTPITSWKRSVLTGASFAASGLADLAVTRAVFSVCRRSFSRVSLISRFGSQTTGSAAEKFAPLAYTQLLLEQKAPSAGRAEKRRSRPAMKLKFVLPRRSHFLLNVANGKRGVGPTRFGSEFSGRACTTATPRWRLALSGNAR